MGELGTVESEERKKLGLRILAEQFDRLDRISDLAFIQVEKGSRLAHDAKINDYDSIDLQATYLEVAARDHLETLRRHITLDGGGIPAMSSFTLIRAAVECAAHGIWLLSSSKVDKRIFRSLQRHLMNRNDVEPLAQSLGISNPEGYARMRERLDGIHGSRGGLRQRSLDRPLTTTAVVSDADRFVKTLDLTGLQVWQACSGLAHGNSSSSLIFMERQRISTNGKVSTYSFTTSAYLIGQMFRVAVDYLDTLTVLYAQQAKANPARRD